MFSKIKPCHKNSSIVVLTVNLVFKINVQNCFWSNCHLMLNLPYLLLVIESIRDKKVINLHSTETSLIRSLHTSGS